MSECRYNNLFFRHSLFLSALHRPPLPYVRCAQNTEDEIFQDLDNLSARAIIVLAGEKNDHIVQVSERMGVPLITIHKSESTAGIFAIEAPSTNLQRTIRRRSRTLKDRSVAMCESGGAMRWTQPDQAALVLHTSGTSGKKKVVPYTLETIVIGSACIIQSWGIGSSDIDLNVRARACVRFAAQRCSTSVSHMYVVGACMCACYLSPDDAHVPHRWYCAELLLAHPVGRGSDFVPRV